MSADDDSKAGVNGESKGFIRVDFSVDADAAAGSADLGNVSGFVEPLDGAHLGDSVNQEFNSPQVDFIDRDNKVLLAEADTVDDGPNDIKVSEDGGKEDMFVDCPDELIAYDGRNSVTDNREAIEISKTQQRVEGEDDMVETRFNESDNGSHNSDLVGELEHLRALLKLTVGEKESFAREYEEERSSVMKEFANLRHLLKALSEQKSLLSENDGRLVDHLHNSETGEGEKRSQLSDAPLHEMINDCSKLIKHALDERSQTEGTIGELHAILSMKDQEIENLNARVNELSVSRDVSLTSLDSDQENLSRSLEVSSKVQVEKDQHIETTVNRMLSSLATVVNQEELLDESVTRKLYHVEKSTSVLIEKYNQFLSESDLLRQCLTSIRSDLSAQDEVETIFLTAHEELLELKRKEVYLAQKISHLEDENGRLVEQLNKDREMIEMENAEIQKLRGELEQEKTRFSNTKEKLSMAVTKGKALVQQRDSLKQSLTNKTSELEKCLTELQEKSTALEAADLGKEELVRSQTLAASLQEALYQRDTMLEECKEILSQIAATEELQSMDLIETVRWLVHEKNALTGISLEYRKLTDALSLVALPETVMSSNFESRVSWLAESFYLAKDEAMKLQDEIARTREAAQNEIGLLTTSLLAETQEKNYLRDEFEEITHKFEGIVEKEHQVSLEKDQMVSMLLEVSGIAMDSQEEAYQPHSDMGMIIDKCFAKIKEQTRISVEPSHVEVEVFERIQSLLYIRDQELMLYEQILEEEMLERSEVNRLSSELVVVSQEFRALKDEKGSLQTYLERSEEKASLLREKLSMAVKKGKGLVQERENMKQLLDEKNGIIEKLKLELQQQESVSNDCRDQISKLSADVENLKQLLDEKNGIIEELKLELQEQESASNDCRDQIRKLSSDVQNLKQFLDEKNGVIETLKLELQQQESESNDFRGQINKLSTDVECIPKLEADLFVMKDQRDNLEQFLVESNSMLQRVIESIDDITLPVDFEEPVEKVKWLAGYLSECQDAKTQVEQELGKVKDEACTLASNLAESQKNFKSLEDALSVEENNLSQLAEEKRELEVAKAYVEQELRKAVEEASSQSSKFAEVCASKKSLEDALLLAENNMSMLNNEKEDAQVSRAAAEMELQKVKEEVSAQTSKLSEAYKTIQSLEDAMSQVQTNVSLLSEENNKGQVGRTSLENEIKKFKEEVDSQSSKLADASSTIKSLEDDLLKAENTISNLVEENKIGEQEISTLNSRLNACMQELDGTHVNLENRSLELSSHLNSLQFLLKDDTLLSLLRQSFEKKIESLKDMDLLLEDLCGHFAEMDSEMLQNYPSTKENYSASIPLQSVLDNIANTEMVNGEVNAADVDSITLYIGKTVEGFLSRNKILADKFESSSTFMDEIIAALVTKLQATREKMIVILENMKSLKQNMNTMKTNKQEQENKIEMMESNITILLSACTDITQELEFEVENSLLELGAVPELEKLNHDLSSDVRAVGGDAVADHQLRLDSRKYVKTTEKLLSAVRNVRNLSKQFQDVRKTMATTIEDLESKLKESRKTCEKSIEERDLNQNKVSKLETDLEALQNLCSDMRLKLQDYQAKEDKWKETVDTEDPLLSASQMKSLFDKIHGIEIPLAEFEVVDLEPHDSVYVKKLFYIIDSVNGLQHQTTLLRRDKEQLLSTLEKQVLEIEHLREEVEEHISDKQDSKNMKNELFELALGLENIIQKLGCNELVGGQKSAGVMELLPVLEKLVVDIVLESENSRSKAQELGAKLLGTQKVVDELSSKVKLLEDANQAKNVSLKLLEDSNQAKNASPEIIREKGVFEAPSLSTRSEISEIEDAGPLGKIAIPPAPSAAHARTLRKGSSDHLAINVDSESDRLITNEETNEDKGHLFKSLNTSGLVPRQGKMVADRIDGIWVSGGRALMSRPRARLGLIAYWLFLHIWLLGTIL